MGLSASQGRMLLLTARKNDLEFQAQQISQRRLILAQQLEEISTEYQDATSNRQMKITLYDHGDAQEGTKKTVNLTYANLVSGVYASGDTYDTGLQPSEAIRTSGSTERSNVAYRLVNSEGDIVISDLSEIPGTITKPKTIKPKTSVGGQDTDLTKFLSEQDNEANSDMTYAYGNNGCIQVTYKVPKMVPGEKEGDPAVQEKDDNGNLLYETKYAYFNANDGSQMEMTEAQFIKDTNAQPSVVTTGGKKSVEFQTKVTEPVDESRLQKGDDGKYRLKDSNGVVLFTYVIDETLKYGSTDERGSLGDGPNYLQDCIRNGKYLLQKGAKDDDDGGKYKWRDLSWDASANITDSYYTDDDEAAKAKYDRLQTQIQNQDKKLELELDNIETQRSAVQTEIDSVQKVIDDNVEDSFKIFNA